MSETTAPKSPTETALLLKKKLLLENKKRKLLVEKQAKTLDALKLSTRALKMVKLKLLKYQKAYIALKKKSELATPPAPPPAPDNSRVEALESQISLLNDDLRRSQLRMSKTLTLLKESKTEAKDVKIRLREALRGAARELAGDAAAAKQLEGELASLRSKAARDQLASQALERELSATRAEILALQDEALETAEEIAERDTEIAELQSQLSDQQATLAAAMVQAQEASSPDVSPPSAPVSMVSDPALLEALEREVAQSQSALAALGDELEGANAALARSEAGRQVQAEKLTGLAEAFAQLQDAHSRSRFAGSEELEEARSRIAELQASLDEENERNEELESARELAEKRLATREKEHEEALLKLWDLEERIQKQGGDVEGALGAKEAEIADLKKGRAALEEQLAAAESEREKALARLKESRDEAARLEAEQQERSGELDDNQRRITELEMRVLTLGQSADDESAKLAKAQAEKETLLEELAALKGQNAELQHSAASSVEDADREPAEKRAARAEGRLKELEEQLMETRTRLLTFHNEMEEVDQARLAAETSVRSLEKDLEFRTSQIQQLENLVTLLEQKEDTLNRQLQAMRRQITELFEENGQIKEELRDKTGKLSTVERTFEETDETLSNIRRRYENTREAFEKAKDELTEARTRALQSMARADEAEKKFARADKAGRSLAEDNKALKRKLDRLQERVAELETLG